MCNILRGSQTIYQINPNLAYLDLNPKPAIKQATSNIYTALYPEEKMESFSSPSWPPQA